MPSASVETTTPFTTYTFKVQAENIVGKGPISMPVSGQFNFNKAEGGLIEEYEVVTRSGLTETWRSHTFHEGNTSELFVVKVNVRPWRILLAGKGGNGGASSGCDGDGGGSGGGGGQFISNDDFNDMPDGENVISVAGTVTAFGLSAARGGNGGGCYAKGGNGACGGGGGTGSGPVDMRYGGAATVAGHGKGGDGHQYYGGHGGGAGGNGGGAQGGRGGPGRASNLRTGVNEYYCAGGSGHQNNGWADSKYGRGGGRSGHGWPMSGPQSGAVIIAYRTG